MNKTKNKTRDTNSGKRRIRRQVEHRKNPKHEKENLKIGTQEDG